MVASLARLALVAGPLLAASLASAAVVPQQMVLGTGEASYSSPSTGARQPDFVDRIVAEAEAAGRTDELMEKWAFSEDDIKVSMSAWRPIVKEDKQRLGKAASALSADLEDAAERIKLMAEATADDTIMSIQPVSFGKVAEKPAPHAMQPGSGWIWNACGSRQEAVVLKTIDVDPDPPHAGQNLTVHATGTVNAPIEEGTYADVVVKLGFIRLLSRRFDVCQLAEENDAELRCPLPPGEYEITQTVELPREIPPAKFNVHATGKTAEGVDLMCMDVAIDFGRR